MKKNFALICTVALILSMLPATTLAASFPDLPNSHWAYDDITALSELGAINGYADGCFRPDDPVTLGEMAKIVSLSFDLRSYYPYDNLRAIDDEGNVVGEDNRDRWWSSYANAISDYYYGVADGPHTFDGDNRAQRYDVVQLLVSALRPPLTSYNIPDDYGTIVCGQFSDLEEHWDWWTSYQDGADIYLAAEMGLINGYPNGTFAPWEGISRAEFCAVVMRALKLRGNIPAELLTPIATDYSVSNIDERTFLVKEGDEEAILKMEYIPAEVGVANVCIDGEKIGEVVYTFARPRDTGILYTFFRLQDGEMMEIGYTVLSPMYDFGMSNKGELGEMLCSYYEGTEYKTLYSDVHYNDFALYIHFPEAGFFPVDTRGILYGLDIYEGVALMRQGSFHYE